MSNSKLPHTKPFVDGEQMGQSLLALRDEVIKRDGMSVYELVLKMNSCLFSVYPPTFKNKPQV